MMLHSVWPTLHNRGIAWKLIDVGARHSIELQTGSS